MKKSIVSIVLALIMVMGALSVFALPNVVEIDIDSVAKNEEMVHIEHTAGLYSTDSEVDKAIRNRIGVLYSLLGKKYFNTDGEKNICGTIGSGHRCDKCKASAVAKSDWFRKILGLEEDDELNPNNFSNSYRGNYHKSDRGERGACLGFAHFAEWYIFKESNSTQVTTYKVITDSCTKNNVQKYAKIGDIIGFDDDHSAIFISCGTGGIYVLHCNWGEPLQINLGTIPYSYANEFTISRSQNRDDVVNYTSNVTGYYYIVTDSEGHNVRDLPSEDGTKKGVLPKDERVLITEYSADCKWGWVEYGDFEGWTYVGNRDLMKFDGVKYNDCNHNYSTFSYENTHPHKEYKKCSLCGDARYTGNTKLVIGCTSCYPADGELYLCTDEEGHNIRNSASESGTTVLGVIPYNEEIVITDKKSVNGEEWGYVTYKDKSGWTNLYYKYMQYIKPYYCPIVTFDAKGGSVSLASKKVYINAPYGELPTPTRTGYKFNGWYTSNDDSITSTTNVKLTENQTLYAHWIPNKYTITYNANGGTGAPANQTKTHGITLTLSNTKPARTGYTFMGWSTSLNGSVSYNAGSTYSSNSNITLYAVWQTNAYTVKYNANGGSGSMSNSSHIYDTAKSLNANAFTRSGYIFLGWSTSSSATTPTYTDKQSVKNLTSTNGSTVNLYAVWQANTYTVKYNSNGGTNTPVSQIKTHGTGLALSATIPTFDGYTFLGWSTSENGSVEYAPGDSYTNNESVTLYAVWEEIVEKIDVVALSEISILDSSYNALDAIPSTSFVAEVSVENISHEGNLTVMLAYYDENGQMLGVRYLYTNPIIGQVSTLGASITNTDGKVAKVKAMVFDSLASFSPLTEESEISK